jgi:hypothetical protein
VRRLVWILKGVSSGPTRIVLVVVKSERFALPKCEYGTVLCFYR